MDDESREARLSAAFVSIADTLVSDFDLLDLIHTLIEACTDLLDSDAGGLLLTDANGDLQLMASSTEDVDVVEVVQLASEQGPCLKSFKTGSAVTVADIAESDDDWPEFRRVALERGYRSMHATPMRLRGRVIGTMNLFRFEVGALSARDRAVAQSLTDVATIAILQERGTRELRDLSAQLQFALESRIVVEQAKGVLAQSLSLNMDDAFRILRGHARSTGHTLQAVATEVTARRLILGRRDAGTAADRPDTSGSTRSS